MPDQGVADHEHAVAAAVVDEGIGRGEVEDAGTRIDYLGLHRVLGGDRVEMPRHQRGGGGVLAGDDVGVDRGADQERAGVGVLEAAGGRRGRRAGIGGGSIGGLRWRNHAQAGQQQRRD